MFKFNSNFLDIAINAAHASWKRGESVFHEILHTHQKFDSNELQNWLAYWMLSRNNPLNLRDNLLDFFNNEAIKLIRESDLFNGHDTVERLAKKGMETGAFTGIATSTISKLAFTVKPSQFNPYDSRVRGGLKLIVRSKIENHDYVSYMHQFHQVRDAISQHLSADFFNTYSEKNIYDKYGNSILLNRISDKYLMLEGGFSVLQMTEDSKLP